MQPTCFSESLGLQIHSTKVLGSPKNTQNGTVLRKKHLKTYKKTPDYGIWSPCRGWLALAAGVLSGRACPLARSTISSILGLLGRTGSSGYVHGSFWDFKRKKAKLYQSVSLLCDVFFAVFLFLTGQCSLQKRRQTHYSQSVLESLWQQFRTRRVESLFNAYAMYWFRAPFFWTPQHSILTPPLFLMIFR